MPPPSRPTSPPPNIRHLHNRCHHLNITIIHHVSTTRSTIFIVSPHLRHHHISRTISTIISDPPPSSPRHTHRGTAATPPPQQGCIGYNKNTTGCVWFIFDQKGRAALTKPPKPFTPTPLIFAPNTVVTLSAHTCVTRSEDAIYYNIANVLDNSVLKILDPATGVADDAFKASIIKRYRREKNGAASGITHEVPRASLLKSHHEDLGESSEAVVACSSAPTAGSG
nr:reverse transcriptase domain-containing protein [Tanacetum cinerariifolium]